MNAKTYIEKFESFEVLLSDFNHAAHVELAWCYLQELPLPEAMIRFRDSLKKFAAYHGKSELYHETITFAFLLIIHERMHLPNEKSRDWKIFSEQNEDLLKNGRSVLLKFYREETLATSRAKRVYLLPDLC